MQENGELIKLDSLMLEELREMKGQQVETNKKLGGIDSRLSSVETRLSSLLEQQMKTNVILNQHERDLMKISDLLSNRVVHLGDRIVIEGNPRVSGIVSLAA